MDVLAMISGIATSIAAASIMLSIKQLIDKSRKDREEKEVKEEVSRITKTLEEEPKDVLTLMRRNVAELREYYTINKQQARNAFSAAIFVCFLGFILFAAGVVLTYIFPTSENVIQYSTIAGTIVEVIAGLFFWLYSKAIKQINIFHESLQGTQQFLTGIHLVDKISEKNRDAAYAYIIQNVIGSESVINLKQFEENES